MPLRQMLISDLAPGLKFTCPRYNYSGMIKGVEATTFHFSWDDNPERTLTVSKEEYQIEGMAIEIPDKPKRRL